MQLVLGGGRFRFDANSVLVGTHSRPRWNKGGQIVSYLHDWDLSGYLTGSGQADLSGKELALRAALAAFPLGDIVLKQDNGNNSATVLKASAAITGVRLKSGPDFVDHYGAEYATQRHFGFAVEGEFPVSGAQTLLLDFSEKLSFSGGLPTYLCRPATNTDAQRQMLYAREPYGARQSGYAVGYLVAPPYRLPIWPAWLTKAGHFGKDSPQREQFGSYTGWRVDWDYEFQSPSFPLVGAPGLWVQ